MYYMCYDAPMDTTIRNLDEATYRELKARAALTGRTLGDLLNEAIRAYLSRPSERAKRGTLRDLVPEPYPVEDDRLSERIDTIVYGSPLTS